MVLSALAALMGASMSEAPRETWRCRNQLEVWCSADGCAAAPPGEFTPMDIHASVSGDLSVCAYSGCWEATAKPIKAAGRLIWAGDGVPFTSGPEGAMTTDVTLLIVEKDGVGFVRVGGLATPLLCARGGARLTDEE